MLYELDFEATLRFLRGKGLCEIIGIEPVWPRLAYEANRGKVVEESNLKVSDYQSRPTERDETWTVHLPRRDCSARVFSASSALPTALPSPGLSCWKSLRSKATLTTALVTACDLSVSHFLTLFLMVLRIYMR